MQQEVYNTAFISYRHLDQVYAMAIYQQLIDAGFDVFIDVNSILVGDRIDDIVFTAIESHAFFLLLLTPGSLERCTNPDDWVLRELAHAYQCDRLIMPIIVDGFDRREFANLPKELSHHVSSVLSVRISRCTKADACNPDLTKLLSWMRTPQDYIEVSQSNLFEVRQTQAINAAVLASWSDYEHRNRRNAYLLSLERGDECYRASDYHKALFYFERALAYDSDKYTPHYNLGLTHLQLGDYASAIEFLNAALTKLKTNKLRRYPKREELVKRADILVALGAVELYRARGTQAHHRNQRYQRAEEYYKQALDGDPQSTTALRALGKLRFMQGQWQAAIQHLKKVVAAKAGSFELFTLIGRVHLKLGELHAAKIAFISAAELSPSSPIPYELLSDIFDNMHTHDKAYTDDMVEACRLAIERDSTNPDIYHRYGQSLEAQGDVDGACRNYYYAIELAPNHPAKADYQRLCI